MNEETKPPTTSDAVTEQDKGRCAPAPGSVLCVELPRRITGKWTRERTDAELTWLASDFQGTCNGERFNAEIRRRLEAPNTSNSATGDRGASPAIADGKA
jgi:hypothetical protein